MKHIVLTVASLLVVYCCFLPARPVAEPGPVAVAMRPASNADRVKVASIYRALADITERDAGQQITSTSVWRTCHSSALRLSAGGTDLPGKYQGLDRAVEQVLALHFSLDDVAMTKELAAKIAAGCREVAKQSGG